MRILTEAGFRPFDSIDSMGSKPTVKVVTDRSTFICTHDHEIKVPGGGWVEAGELEVGDVITGGQRVMMIEDAGVREVFDVMNVEATHSFYTEGVIAHNCAFVYIDECAFIANWEEFFSSVYPTISSGKTTKMLLTSCVTGDTLVWGEDGLVEVSSFVDESHGIEDPSLGYIVPGYKVRGRSKMNTGRVMVNSGETDTLIIKTDYTELECSRAHKLWVVSEGIGSWVRAEDISEGDLLTICQPKDIWLNRDEGRTISDAFFLGKMLRNTGALEIPVELTAMSQANISAMIQGIMYDVKMVGNDLVFSDAPAKLIKQLRILLHFMGVASSIDKGDLCIRGEWVNDFIRTILNGEAPKDRMNRVAPVKSIRTGYEKVYDFSLDHVEGDPWCHSVIYNGVLGHQTPNGLNHFYKICKEAQEEIKENGAGKNGYKYIEVPWHRVPGRDEEWKQATLAAMSFNMEQFEQEFNCSFIGSSRTLVAGATLKTLSATAPIKVVDGLCQYKVPEKNRSYALIADVSRGKGLDYSAFSIIDTTEMPYEQVCTFRDNTISTGDYAAIIFNMATFYNEAQVLVEVNDLGAQVADVLHLDYGYENMLFTESGGKHGTRISGGFGGGKVNRGINTSSSVKAIGCAMLKMLLEQQQLILHDQQTLDELKQFVKVAKSYQADTGHHDDTVMPLVLFGWLSNQPYFKDLTDIDTVGGLRDKTDEEIESDLLPFGFILDGNDMHEQAVLSELFR